MRLTATPSVMALAIVMGRKLSGNTSALNRDRAGNAFSDVSWLPSAEYRPKEERVTSSGTPMMEKVTDALRKFCVSSSPSSLRRWPSTSPEKNRSHV